MTMTHIKAIREVVDRAKMYRRAEAAFVRTESNLHGDRLRSCDIKLIAAVDKLLAIERKSRKAVR